MLRELRTKLDSICIRKGISGCCINIQKSGEEILNYNFGFANFSKNQKINKSSKFHLASLSKSITAMSFLRYLESQNKISLNTNIAEILETNSNYKKVFMNFKIFQKYAKQITLYHLISHRSGIRHYHNSEEFLEKKFHGNHHKDLIQNLQIFANDKLLFKPGTNYNYSSYGYILLTILIRIIYKTSFHVFVKKFLKSPLYLRSLNVYNDKVTVEQYNRIFKEINSTYKNKYDADFIVADNRNTYMKGGAGMFIANAFDMTKFIYKIVFGKFFNEDIYKKYLIGISRIKDENWYGLGWHQNKKTNPTKIWHTGGAIGGSNFLGIDIPKKMAICILCNTQISSNFSKIVLETVEKFDL